MTIEQQSGGESLAQDVAEHVLRTATAVTLYSYAGLMNPDSVKQAAEFVRPPANPDNDSDMLSAEAHDYYSRFLPLARAVRPDADTFVASDIIYKSLKPVSDVLDMMLDETDPEHIDPKYVAYAQEVLPELAERIRQGLIQPN